MTNASGPAREAVHRVKTYILIQALQRFDLNQLAREVERLPDVEHVDIVSGPYDLIAQARTHDPGGQRRAVSGLHGVLRTAGALVVGPDDREQAA
jgi:DNA-binding Lrp family transcriptional regulator